VVAVDVQFASTHTDWATLRAASLRAEREGFDAIWVFDHLAGVSLGGTTNLECFTWLGALAEATSTVDLGVLVANTFNRQLGTLAAAAASVSRISGRRFLFGIGAGTSPKSAWAAEQIAVGADLDDRLADRHRRVARLLDLTERMWSPTRSEQFATFPQPVTALPRIVGVNSVALSVLAGRRAEGINVAWNHPRRDEFLDAARAAAAGRPFLATVWAKWAPDLLDPEHPVRREMDARSVDRLVLVVIDDVAAFAERS
jgi:alkanesulfonate monooxygenase SsuD/methylene tetrahydromethanopterin reductase-like flavin-dependent oxidoreductase (luciferase family)